MDKVLELFGEASLPVFHIQSLPYVDAAILADGQFLWSGVDDDALVVDFLSCDRIDKLGLPPLLRQVKILILCHCRHCCAHECACGNECRRCVFQCHLSKFSDTLCKFTFFLALKTVCHG